MQFKERPVRAQVLFCVRRLVEFTNVWVPKLAV